MASAASHPLSGIYVHVRHIFHYKNIFNPKIGAKKKHRFQSEKKHMSIQLVTVFYDCK
jgi:hypothetical protein